MRGKTVRDFGHASEITGTINKASAVAPRAMARKIARCNGYLLTVISGILAVTNNPFGKPRPCADHL